MKNHVFEDGKLLQSNKQWSHLKQRQRSWMHEVLQREHAAYVAENGRLPMKHSKEDVLDKVHEQIVARDIWIPCGEFRLHMGKALDRLNRKNSLFCAKAASPITEDSSGQPDSAASEAIRMPETSPRVNEAQDLCDLVEDGAAQIASGQGIPLEDAMEKIRDALRINEITI